MIDQAQSLRKLVDRKNKETVKSTRVITVTSGKGGVGKSNFTLNFALSLSKRGYKVLIFDADIGLANIDVLLGVSPKYNLYHLLTREKTIWEIIETCHYGLQFIAGGSGFKDLIQLKPEQITYFLDQVKQLNGQVDYIIFDTGAGLSDEVLKFIVSADDCILVTTPEPTSITDAYAIIKMIHSMEYSVKFKLVINRIYSRNEGQQTSDKISLVTQKFLKINIDTLGFVSDDQFVPKAVKRQVPFTVAYPNCHASRGITRLVDRFIEGQVHLNHTQGGIQQFFQKIIRFVK